MSNHIQINSDSESSTLSIEYESKFQKVKNFAKKDFW